MITLKYMRVDDHSLQISPGVYRRVYKPYGLPIDLPVSVKAVLECLGYRIIQLNGPRVVKFYDTLKGMDVFDTGDLKDRQALLKIAGIKKKSTTRL